MPTVRTTSWLVSGLLVGVLSPPSYGVPLAGTSAGLLVLYGLVRSYSSGSMNVRDEGLWFNDLRQLDRLHRVGRKVSVQLWLVLPLLGIIAGALARLMFHAISQA